MKKHTAIVCTLLMFVFVSLFSFSTASAASPNISRAYNSSVAIPNGSLVGLVSGSSTTVEETNTSNAGRLVGIAVQTNQSLVAVNPSSGNVQVATNGTVNTLVSNVNGDIKVGQAVAVSPFNGVGMKSAAGDRIVGTAVTSFNTSTAGATTEQVEDSSGKTHTITIGYVRLVIGIGTESSSSFSVQNLQQFVEGLTGHPISIIRLVICIIIAFVSILSIVILVYASIYGSIVSIGRNPLAKLAVFRTLTSVIGMVTLIAAISSITIYLLLY